MRLINMSEVFEMASLSETKQDKIQVIRDNFSPQMVEVIKRTFHADWAVPLTEPPFEPSPFDDAGCFYRESSRLYLFDKSDPRRPAEMTDKKTEGLFIGVLEYISAKDSKLLLSMVKGKIPFKGLTKAFFKEALPEAFDEKR